MLYFCCPLRVLVWPLVAGVCFLGVNHSSGELASSEIKTQASPVSTDEDRAHKDAPIERTLKNRLADVVKGNFMKSTNGSGKSENPPSEKSPLSVPPTDISGKAADIVPPKRVEVQVHLAKVIDLPQPVGQVFLTDSKIADVQLGSPTKAYVYGRAPGTIEILFTSQDTKTLYRYEIVVSPNLTELRRLIEKISPLHRVEVTSLPEGILLQGTVDSAKTADDIKSVAQQFVGASGVVVNQLTLKKATQVNLKVRIVEIAKKVLKSMGVNWQSQVSSGGHFTFGVQSGQTLDTTNTGNFATLTSAGHYGIGARFTNGKNDLATLVDALAEEKLATILAEPNLITRSGEEANFLVGGEYPYPVISGTGTSATTTIQFKQYGISLSFTPTVVGNSISLHVKPEVSDIDDTQELKDSAGSSYPSIKTRRAESTIELGNGQSMVMAGLLSNKTSHDVNALPGLANIPILGALFRSTEFQSDKTELVIIVTPYLVQPIDNAEEIKVPFEGMKYINPLDVILFGGALSEPVGSAKLPSSLLGEAGFSY